MMYGSWAGSALLIAWAVCWYFFFFRYNQPSAAADERSVRPDAAFRRSSRVTLALLSAWTLVVWSGWGVLWEGAPTSLDAKVAALLGTIFLLAGQVLLVASRRSLRFLSNRDLLLGISARRSHDGPYRFVPHPMYIGLFLALLGTSLVLLNAAGAVIAVLLVVPVLMWRVRCERRAEKPLS